MPYDWMSAWKWPTGGAVPWLPAANWAQTPWAGYQQGDQQAAAQMQGWFNTLLPWLQAYQQGTQWGTEFDWRKAMDEYQKTLDAWSQKMQEQQFGWTKEQDVWARGLQEQQLREQKRAANLAAFGRRWQPATRWS